MNLAIRAARDEVAQQRLLTAATELAGRFENAGLPVLVARLQSAQARDPDIRAMQQRENLADILEALVAATAPKEAGKRSKREG